MIAAIWTWGAVAHADRVHLIDGAIIEGKAVRQGDRIVIEVDAGRVAVPAREVARIEPSASPLQQAEQRHAGLAPRDVAGRVALANFCRDHGLRAREAELLREVIELDSDHAEARARLGYVRSGETWASREQSLRAQGLVQHEGRWLTREQVLEIERLRAQAATAAHERDKAAAELAVARSELAQREQQAETASAATASGPAPAPRLATQAHPHVYAPAPLLFWHAPYAHAHHHDHDCGKERCERRARPRVRDDGRPPWPIVGVKDPFDYLH